MSARMTAGELDARLTSTGPDAPWWPPARSPVFRQIRALRGLLWSLRSLEQTEADARSGLVNRNQYVLPGEVDLIPADLEELESERARGRQAVDSWCDLLAEYQDVSWVPRPWLDSLEH
jgi:hypothetical protein